MSGWEEVFLVHTAPVFIIGVFFFGVALLSNTFIPPALPLEMVD